MPYLTNLADVARSAGLTVVEQAGWRTRGHGAQTDVRAIICHHTGGSPGGDAPSLGTVQNGRPDLAGPLSHFVLSRSGVVYVVAAGQCWHTGNCFQSWQENPHAIGIEAEATGSATWPEVQMVAYAKLCAALAKAFDVPVSRVLGHKEVAYPAGRKPDPNFDMAAFRTQVARYIAGVKDPEPEPIQEDDEYMSIDHGPATAGDEYQELHVPINGNRYLRLAVAYGGKAKCDISVVDDTPANGVGSWVKTVATGVTVDADRPGPWDLSKVVATYDNLSHVVVRYQSDSKITGWTNNRA